MKKLLLWTIIVLPFFVFVPSAFSHCEIPCGIYDDEMRVHQIEEHLTTIEKSMKAITDLSKPNAVNYNQLARWIDNKETHAGYIQHIVAQYFMTQRVKPVSKEMATEYEKYVNQLQLLHEMLIYAMKCKQTTDLENVEKLRTFLKSFSIQYFGPEAKK